MAVLGNAALLKGSHQHYCNRHFFGSTCCTHSIPVKSLFFFNMTGKTLVFILTKQLQVSKLTYIFPVINWFQFLLAIITIACWLSDYHLACFSREIQKYNTLFWKHEGKGNQNQSQLITQQINKQKKINKTAALYMYIKWRWGGCCANLVGVDGEKTTTTKKINKKIYKNSLKQTKFYSGRGLYQRH